MFSLKIESSKGIKELHIVFDNGVSSSVSMTPSTSKSTESSSGNVAVAGVTSLTPSDSIPTTTSEASDLVSEIVSRNQVDEGDTEIPTEMNMSF